MKESDRSTPERGHEPAERAEDVFVAMARQPEFAPYLGRMVDATDEELRSLFGLMMAALRQTAREMLSSVAAATASPAPEFPSRGSREELESQVRQLAAALRQRDEHIGVLKRELEKRQG